MDVSHSESKRFQRSPCKGIGYMFVEMAPGALVAEVGAGKGELTLAVARRVGNSGRVCTTEIDPKALGHLENLTAKEKNITVVKATETDEKPSARLL